MKKIVAINGSLRANSSNGDLLKAIAHMSNGLDFSVYKSLDLLPHFNPDLETPDSVLDFKRTIKEADYLLIVTPEYAHGAPGVLKNSLDWLVSDKDLPGKEVILLVCGAGDGKYAMTYLKEVLSTMSLSILPERCLCVSAIRSKFSGGKLTDIKLKSKFQKILSTIE